MNVANFRKSSGSEESPDYLNVIVQDEKRRVIVCRHGLQWIIQLPGGKRGGAARWRNRSYCRSKKALIHFSHTHTGGIGTKELAILDALPDWIEEGGARDDHC